MSDEPPDQVGDDGTDTEIDLGQPIRQLARFEHEASPGLLLRIRRAIHRRTAVAQLTSFSASVPLVILKEFWLLLIGQLGQKSARKDVPRGEKTS
jgi:hypothetical protein